MSVFFLGVAEATAEAIHGKKTEFPSMHARVIRKMPGAECLRSDVAKGFGMDNSPTEARVKITASLAGASNTNDEHIPLFPKYPPLLWFFKMLYPEK